MLEFSIKMQDKLLTTWWQERRFSQFHYAAECHVLKATWRERRGNLPGRQEFTRLNSTQRVGPSRGEKNPPEPQASLSHLPPSEKITRAFVCWSTKKGYFLFSQLNTKEKIHLGCSAARKRGVTSLIRPWEWRQIALASALATIRHQMRNTRKMSAEATKAKCERARARIKCQANGILSLDSASQMGDSCTPPNR